MNSTPTSTDRVPAPKTPVRFRLLYWLCAFFLVITALVFWLTMTASGTRTTFTLLEKVLPQLSVTGVSGELASDLRLQSLQWKSDEFELEMHGVHLQWQASQLFVGAASVQELTASSVRVATAHSDSASVFPEHLALPLRLKAEQLAVGTLLIESMQGQQRQKDAELRALTGQFAWDGQRYMVNAIADSDYGKASARLSLNGVAPFDLSGVASLESHPHPEVPPVTLDLQLVGNLRSFHASLDARPLFKENPLQAALTGHAELDVFPFSQPALGPATIAFQHFNPAAWHASLPEADLDLRADVLLQQSPRQGKGDETSLRASVSVRNLLAGNLDKKRIPVEAVSANLQILPERLMLEQLEVSLPGKSAINGRGDLAWGKAMRADGKFQLRKINLKDFSGKLYQTAINGDLDLKTTDGKQILARGELNDVNGNLQLNAVADLVRKAIHLEKLNLTFGDAHLIADGSYQLTQQKFQLNTQIKNVNPARWGKFPAGDVSADIVLDGILQPKWTVHALVRQLGGHYAGQALKGHIDADLQSLSQWLVRPSEIAIGSNKLAVQGRWGQAGEQLSLNVDMPALQELNPVLQIWDLNLTGKMKGQIQLSGQLRQPGLQASLQAEQLNVEYAGKHYRAATVGLNVKAPDLRSGPVQSALKLRQIQGDIPLLAHLHDGLGQDTQQLEQLDWDLQGQLSSHQSALQLTVNPRQKLSVQLRGAVQSEKDEWRWSGELSSLQLSGQPSASLQAPVKLDVSEKGLRAGAIVLQTSLAQIQAESLEIGKAGLISNGSVQDIRLVDILQRVRQQTTLSGDLRLQASWKLRLSDTANVQVSLKRQSGELRFQDPDGTGASIPAGLKDFQLNIRTAGLISGTDREKLIADIRAEGSRLGLMQLHAESALHKRDGIWTLAGEQALSGSGSAEIPDLEWMGPLIYPGLVMKGQLRADATLGGKLNQPDWKAHVKGSKLELAFASEGLLLPNGELDADINGMHLRLNQLAFASTVNMVPQHAQFKGLDLVGKKGEFKASGDIDLGKETGSIQANWQQFPLLQRKDRWLVVSGEAGVKESANVWSLQGKLTADGAYFRLPKMPPPSLSSDVIVQNKRSQKTAGEPDPNAKKVIRTRLDMTFDMGPKFVFVGRGLDTGLAGSLRLRSADGSPLQANGSISTRNGLYEGYGQQLEIERGILNFQGPPLNPGLNILAVRPGLASPVGVEVIGTVANPQVRLYSDTAMPDSEKLAWLVLGRGSDQLSSGDASLLLSAASAIFGGDGSRNIPRDVVQGLGFDEFSIGSAKTAAGSRLPGQTIAGATGVSSSSSSPSDQVVTVGKRLMPGLVLSIERGLGDASGALKLSWQLTRRVTVIGRAGSESALDVNYTFSFN